MKKVKNNPTEAAIEKDLTVPLYYAGLTDTARIREMEGSSRTLRLDHEFHIILPVNVPARGLSWYVIE